METPNEVPHQGIIANHHFAKASSECIGLYRDGYLLSAVMVSPDSSFRRRRSVLQAETAADRQGTRYGRGDPQEGLLVPASFYERLGFSSPRDLVHESA